jgi:hypothetical protein
MATIARQTKFLHRTIWENGEKNSPRNQEVEPKCYINLIVWTVSEKMFFFVFFPLGPMLKICHAISDS